MITVVRGPGRDRAWKAAPIRRHRFQLFGTVQRDPADVQSGLIDDQQRSHRRILCAITHHGQRSVRADHFTAARSSEVFIIRAR
jgi:hypothetical protein